MRQRNLRHGLLLLTACGVSIFVAACGGGGGGTSAGAGSVPVPVPTANSASSTISVAATASTPAIPAVGNISGTVSLPAASAGAGTSVAVTSSLVPPASVVALSSALRAPQDVVTPYLYEALTFSSSVTFSATPGFSITLPAGTNMTQNFYAAQFAAGAWDKIHAQLGVVTPGSTTVVFAGSASPVTIPAGTLYFAFYGVVVSTPAPSPSPTTAPTTAPTSSPTTAPASIVLTPSTLSFTTTGAAANQTFNASETGYAGAFTVGACAGGSTPAATVVAGPNANQFTVTPVAAGTCTISVRDTNGQSATETVTVTTTTVGGN